MTGAAGYMALVLAEAVAGSLAFLWFSPLWNEVKRGFFTLTAAILLVLALGAWLSARAAEVPGDAAGRWSATLTLATTGAIGLSFLLMLLKRHLPARMMGIASVVVSIATLVAMAGTGRQTFPVSLFQLVAGAAFLGSITDGLLLGHWYLTDRGLARGPIDRLTSTMLVAVVFEAVAIVSSGFSGVETAASLNPLLTAGALAPWIALGMVTATGLIALLTRAALKGERASAVQSATGFYYLAVVTAFTAEVAVKTRFLV
ncbi:MAG: hypothetical protein OEV60_00215 [Actinomycetota bacterium]|nr:hypothetical protein [Actinomycetota bacterium]MDH5223685.1 hypothetical protein [Actinomycetota bacterium]MDH5312289.1 hypothetical protein [Actinomycetota bacterium]